MDFIILSSMTNQEN